MSLLLRSCEGCVMVPYKKIKIKKKQLRFTRGLDGNCGAKKSHNDWPTSFPETGPRGCWRFENIKMKFK